MSTIHPVDAVLVVLILAAIAGIGAHTSWRRRHATVADDYFLGGKNMAWWAICGSLFASNIGTEHFIGQAGSGAASGLPVALYEWTAGWLIVLLGEVFAPVYMRAGVSTVPEWCELRFGVRARIIVSALSLIACIVTKISATLFAGAVLLEVVAGWSLWLSAPLIVLATGLYSATGGLEAVMLADVAQAMVFIAGGVAATVVSMQRVGGWGGMRQTFNEAGLDQHLHLLRPADHPSYPTLGLLTGQLVGSTWYWCVDQVIVQRVLAARSDRHAAAGCAAAGYLKLLPPFIVVVPGLAARALFERCRLDGGGDEGWCATRLDDPRAANGAFAELIVRELPPGVVGLVLAAMVCAMMSSLSSQFSSAAAILAHDVYKRHVRPGAEGSELILVGRVATCLVCILSFGWLPLVARQQGEFYLTVQNASQHLAPALAVVVAMGVASARVTGIGAVCGLAVGSTLGIAQYAVSLAYEAECRLTAADGHQRGNPGACLHFTYVALIVGVTTAVVTAVASALTRPAAESPASATRRKSPHTRMHEDVPPTPAVAAGAPPATRPSAQPTQPGTATVHVDVPGGASPLEVDDAGNQRETRVDWVDTIRGRQAVRVAGALLVAVVAVLVAVFA